VLVKLPNGLFVVLVEGVSVEGKTPYCDGLWVVFVLLVSVGLEGMVSEPERELDELSVLFDKFLLFCSGNTPYCDGVCVLFVLTPGPFIAFEGTRCLGLSSRTFDGKTPYWEGEFVALVLFVELPKMGLPVVPIEPDPGVRDLVELSLSLRDITLGSVDGKTPYCEGVFVELVLLVSVLVARPLLVRLFTPALLVLLSRLPLVVTFAPESPVGKTPY